MGSKTEVAPLERHARSTLKSRHRQATPARPLRANSGLDRAFVRVLLFCDDVHALEVLRVDGFFLHYAGLFCFVDQCRE